MNNDQLNALERTIDRQSHQIRLIRHRLRRIDQRNTELASIVVALGKRVVSLSVSGEKYLTKEKSRTGHFS